MLELKKLSWLFFRISLCMNYSHNIYTLPSISGELRTFTINRWQYKDLSRGSVSNSAVCSYKKKMNTLYGVCLQTTVFLGSKPFISKFLQYNDIKVLCNVVPFDVRPQTSFRRCLAWCRHFEMISERIYL